MSWLKENRLAVLIAVGIVATTVFIRREANDERIRSDQHRFQQEMVACIRNANFKALSASFIIRASEARRTENPAAADYYEAIADGIVMTISSPKGLEGSRQMIEVERHVRNGKDVYILSPRAQALQREGCRLAYN